MSESEQQHRPKSKTLRSEFPSFAKSLVISHTKAWAIKSREHKQKCLHSRGLIHKILCGHLPPLYPIRLCVCGPKSNITSLPPIIMALQQQPVCWLADIKLTHAPSQLHQSEKSWTSGPFWCIQGSKNLVSLSLHLRGARAPGAKRPLKAGK